MTVRLSPKKKRIRVYINRPFKNRKRIEESLKEVLDLMDKKEYQEAVYKGRLFVTKLEITIMKKLEKQVRDSKRQDKD